MLFLDSVVKDSFGLANIVSITVLTLNVVNYECLLFVFIDSVFEFESLADFGRRHINHTN